MIAAVFRGGGDQARRHFERLTLGALFLAALAARHPQASGAPPPGLPLEERLAFVGDTGTGDRNQMAVRDQLQRFPVSRVFLVGDNVYDNGERHRIEKVYDRVYAPLMAKGIAFHAALGNHDVRRCDVPALGELLPDARAYGSLALRCDVAYHLGHASFGYVGGRRYYSVATGAASPPLAEVFVLDSNTLHCSQSKLLLRQDTPQTGWLDAALGASRAVWKIVVLHHPPHSPYVPVRRWLFVPIGGGRAREVMLDRQLSPILRKHRVDVVVAAHNHFYARMVPQERIRYFVTGGGGRKVYAFEDEPGYVAAGGAFHHFLYVRLTPERFEYYAIDAGGASRDAGWWAKGAAVDTPLPPGALPPPAAKNVPVRPSR